MIKPPFTQEATPETIAEFNLAYHAGELQHHIKRRTGSLLVPTTGHAVYMRRVRIKAHWLRGHAAWAISDAITKRLIENGVSLIMIHILDTDEIVTARIEDFVAYGKCVYVNDAVIAQHDPQHYLTHRYWIAEDARRTGAIPTPPEHKKPTEPKNTTESKTQSTKEYEQICLF